MATATTFNDDFIIFQSTDAQAIFTVVDTAGDPVNIAAATAISWAVRSLGSEAAVLTLTLAGGGIALVGGGLTGQFRVNLTAVQTAALAGGVYEHMASLTLATLVNTVVVGRMQVGTNWSYNPAQVGSVPLFAVRRAIGDVLASDRQMMDTEIEAALDARGGSIFYAAADCCRALGAQYLRKVDTTSPGGISTAYGAQGEKYLKMAAVLEQQGRFRGAGGMPYAGGISISDKVRVEQNTDRVQPSFVIAMMDNTLPVGQVGNENLTLPRPAGAS